MSGMDEVVNVHDLKTHYSHYLDQVIGGKEIVLAKHGKPVAKIIPYIAPKEPRKPGWLKGKIWTSDDFDEPMMFLWDVGEDTPSNNDDLA